MSIQISTIHNITRIIIELGFERDLCSLGSSLRKIIGYIWMSTCIRSLKCSIWLCRAWNHMIVFITSFDMHQSQTIHHFRCKIRIKIKANGCNITFIVAWRSNQKLLITKSIWSDWPWIHMTHCIIFFHHRIVFICCWEPISDII